MTTESLLRDALCEIMDSNKVSFAEQLQIHKTLQLVYQSQTNREEKLRQAMWQAIALFDRDSQLELREYKARDILLAALAENT